MWEGGTGKKDEQELTAGSLPLESLDIVKIPASRTVRSKCYLMVYGINNMVLIIPVMVFSTAAHKEG